jgi:hypothetical protein
MPTETKHTSTDDRLKNPASHFEKPSQVANDRRLSHGQKEEALNTWEQDARQLLTASNEGMTASDEGNTRDEVSLDDIARAKQTIAEMPKNKRAHLG